MLNYLFSLQALYSSSKSMLFDHTTYDVCKQWKRRVCTKHFLSYPYGDSSIGNGREHHDDPAAHTRKPISLMPCWLHSYCTNWNSNTSVTLSWLVAFLPSLYHVSYTTVNSLRRCCDVSMWRHTFPYKHIAWLTSNAHYESLDVANLSRLDSKLGVVTSIDRDGAVAAMVMYTTYVS